MLDVLAQIGLILFYIVLFGSLLLTFIGLPGNWLLVVMALIVTLIGKLGSFGWNHFFIVLGLAVVGEIVESALGLVVVARKGGTRWGVLGSLAGGFGGVVLGAAIIPPIGSLVLGFVGAFAGAVAGEYFRSQQTEEALRIGFWSFVGRAMAIMGKALAGLGIVWIMITRTWS